jgi:lysyl-tRNA synthetase class 2
MVDKNNFLRCGRCRAIRAYFDEQGFLEVHTPRLVGLPGQEPYLDPMWTKVHQASVSGSDLPASHAAALITSPEYAMKKLLGLGFDKIYDLGPCFVTGAMGWNPRPRISFIRMVSPRGEPQALMKDTEEISGSLRIDYSKSVCVSFSPSFSPRCHAAIRQCRHRSSSW